MQPSSYNLIDFIKESNRIEGIYTEPSVEEIAAYEQFLSKDEITIESLVTFVSVIQPDAKLRLNGETVMVGSYMPPVGGMKILYTLDALLESIKRSRIIAFKAHKEYESLHPFTDGNGRSGRVLWLHMMGGIPRVSLGFLHTWYYQSLEN